LHPTWSDMVTIHPSALGPPTGSLSHRSGPEVTGISIRRERPPHTVTTPVARTRLLFTKLYVNLATRKLLTLEPPLLLLLHPLLLTEDLVCGAGGVAGAHVSLVTRPATAREAPTVAMLSLVALLVGGEELGSVDVLADLLTLGS